MRFCDKYFQLLSHSDGIIKAEARGIKYKRLKTTRNQDYHYKFLQY